MNAIPMPEHYRRELFDTLEIRNRDDARRAVGRLLDAAVDWAMLGFWLPDWEEWGEDILRSAELVMGDRTPRPIRREICRYLVERACISAAPAYDWENCEVRGGVWYSGIGVGRLGLVVPTGEALGLFREITDRDPAPDDVVEAFSTASTGSEQTSLSREEVEANVNGAIAAAWHWLRHDSGIGDGPSSPCRCAGCAGGRGSAEIAVALGVRPGMAKAVMTTLREWEMARCAPIVKCERTGGCAYGLWRALPLPEAPAPADDPQLGLGI